MISLLIIVCLYTSLTDTAPLQVQLLQPMLQPQQMSLQQQLMALQQLQALRRLNGVQYPSLNFPRPLLILLPNANRAGDTDKILNRVNLRHQDSKKNHGIEDAENDSIVIEADSPETDKPQEPQKAVLLVPNDGRFSIGDFISNIPFLPIEINVPDSISWIYNGISSIISGIGQRLPFRPQTLNELESMNQDQVNMKLNSMNTQRVAPVLVMPLGHTLPLFQ